jgi:N utilization substance protein B
MPKERFTDLRRKGRVVALQSLYAADVRGNFAGSSLEWLADEEQLPERAMAFAQELVDGVVARGQALDQVIQQFAPAWPVAQLAPVDRNILRIAILELLHNPETPDKTAINEAVELAKIFGSDNSSKFVNGVLGSVIGNREVAHLATVGSQT